MSRTIHIYEQLSWSSSPEVASQETIIPGIGLRYCQPDLKKVCRARINQIARRPFWMELFLEVMQALEIIKLVDVFVDKMHYMFNGRVCGFFTHARKST